MRRSPDIGNEFMGSQSLDNKTKTTYGNDEENSGNVETSFNHPNHLRKITEIVTEENQISTLDVNMFDQERNL